MRKIIWGLGALLLSGCNGSSVEQAKSELSRETTPIVSSSDLVTFRENNQKLAFEIYHQLSSSSSELLFSPYSVSVALSMVYPGAKGDTKSQMAEVLHYELATDKLMAAYNAIDLDLATRADAVEKPSDSQVGFALQTANAVWAQKKLKFEQEYLDALAVNYGAGVNLEDFALDAEGSRKSINAWVADQTKDMIPELLGKGSVDSGTRLVLTNAVYFKASWAEQFKEDNTEDGKFTTLSGKAVTSSFMNAQSSVGYYAGENFEAIRLPYLGNEVSMGIVLPASGKFAEVESTWSADTLESITQGFVSKEVEVSLPKWKTDSSFSLADTLQALGLSLPFGDQANFSGISQDEALKLTSVVHQAKISVDEGGTEAAAATAVQAGATSAYVGDEVPRFIANRPYLYYILDEPTHTLLFLGRVLQPSF